MVWVYIFIPTPLKWTLLWRKLGKLAVNSVNSQFTTELGVQRVFVFNPKTTPLIVISCVKIKNLTAIRVRCSDIYSPHCCYGGFVAWWCFVLSGCGSFCLRLVCYLYNLIFFLCSPPNSLMKCLKGIWFIGEPSPNLLLHTGYWNILWCLLLLLYTNIV